MLLKKRPFVSKMNQLYKDLYLTALINAIDAKQPLVRINKILNKYADTLDSDEEGVRLFLNTYIRRGMWDEFRSRRLHKNART
jgi:hypothetical protein